MTDIVTPGQGPTFAPPTVPEGWIARWHEEHKRYYFVDLSNGVSQWETPEHKAPTTATYYEKPQVDIQNNRPSSTNSHNIIKNADGSQSILTTDGNIQPASSDRGLSGNIGQFAMNQLLGNGKKPGKSNSGSGGLGALAGQFLGGSSHGGTNHSKPSATSAITGTLVNSLLGGKSGKNGNPHSQQSSHSNLMSTVGGLFGKNDKQSKYGYPQSGGQIDYSNPAPPNNYPQNNSGYLQNQAPPQPLIYPNQNFYPPHSSQPQSHNNFYPPPTAGQSYNPPSGQQPYNVPNNQNYQQYGNQQPNYEHYSNNFAGGKPPLPYQQTSGQHSSGPGYNGPPVYPGNYSPAGYQNSQGPPLPTGSHPNQGSYGSPGGHGNQNKW